VSSLTWSHTITSANKIVVMVGIGDGAPGTLSSVTFNSLALTYVGGQTDTNPWCRVETWERHTPSVATANVVVTAGSTMDQLAAGATGFIDAATALGTPSTKADATTNPNVTVVDTANGDIVVSVVSLDGSTPATTPGGTQLWEFENLAADIDVNAQRQTASGANTVCSWTNSETVGNHYAAMGVAVKAATAGTAGLFRGNPMSGLGAGGPFFADPLTGV